MTRRAASLCLLAWLPAAALAEAPTPAPASVSLTQIKQKNAEAQAENQLILEAQAALQAKDYPKAEAALQKLTAMDPSDWQYQQGLANAEFGQGKYEEALKTYEGALLLAQKAKLDPKLKRAMGAMYVQEGNAYIKLKRNKDAVAAYQKAAALDPSPATAYWNLCATEYNIGEVDAALKDCDQAIAADPTRADAYFIKGSLLLGEAGTDAAGKTTPPPGTVEALQTYLRLAPTGSHADDVKQMLDFLGIKPGG